ncbi:MAG: hypothetical protein WBE69_22185, partial [Candidatus Binataceae bacterium]
FTVEVPGLVLPHPPEDAQAAGTAEELDQSALKVWLERQPRCTTNARGTVEGDPLNLVIVGDRASIQECLSNGTRPSRSRSAPPGRPPGHFCSSRSTATPR